MRKIFFSLTLLAFCQLIFAQKIEVIKNVQIPAQVIGTLPIISPTGDYLLLTGSDAKGLQKYDLTTKNLSTITSDRGAGFGAKISQDGSQVIYRNTEYKGKLRYTTLKSMDVETGKETVLIESTRNLQGFDMTDGTVLAVDNGKLVKKRVTGDKVSARNTPPVTSIKEGKLYVTTKRKAKEISPSGKDKSYLWSSVSPDGKKILYYVIETANSYVCDIDGSNVTSLGVLRAPKWMGNDWVVGMVDYDNGEVVTSSQIVAVSANGTGRTVLTDNSVIAMNPSASDDATKITYNTADGKIFIMDVKTSK